jgi:hypothetical protein
MVKRDTNRYDLRVKTAHKTAVIDTTRNHLFWDVTRGHWVRAGKLRLGDQLRTSNGAVAAVVGGYTPKHAVGWMWDISVPGGNDHDFYIDVATTAVLVHNCPVPKQRIGNYGKSEVPSWVSNQGETPFVGETPAQTATRIMDEQYGEGEWEKGPGTEYNKIVKWASRAFK